MPTVLYILQTALLPIYSKLSDMYGRAQCYTFALVFYITFNIVMATANNYKTLVGGQVMYAFGNTGVNILSPTTIADFTNVVDNCTAFQVPSLGYSLFAVWETKFAAKPIIPLAKWETRTPIYGVLALSTVTIISFVNWQFFTTYLMVSRKFSAATAIMIGRGYTIAYIVCELLVSYLMKRFHVWRPIVWSGDALTILCVGLMIPAH